VAEAVEIAIALLAKDAASSVLSHVGGKLDDLGKAGGIAKVALAGLTAGIGAAALAGVQFAKAAAEEEAGVVRMQQAFRNAGVEITETWNAAIEENIAAMERSTAFSDGEMRDALSALVASTGSAEEGYNRLSFAQDLARGTGMDLVTASKLLGKLTDENVNVLKRYGVSVKEGADATDVLAAVQEKFGGQAAAFAETATGKWQIFQGQMDNLKEDIGSALLPAFSGLADVAIGAVDGIRAALSNETVQAAIGAITGALGMAKDIAMEFFGVITGTAPDAGAALTKAIGPDAAKMVMNVLATIRDIVKAVIGGDVPAVFNTLGEKVPALFETLLKFVGDAVPKIGAALLAWAKEFIAWIAPQIEPMLRELLGLLSQALKWLGDHADEIGEMLVQWGLKFGEFIIGTAIPALLEHLPGIIGTLANWVITEAIPGALRIFAELGRGIVRGIADGLGGLKDAVWNAIRQAFASIDFWVGPFHISGTSGITVSMPQLNLPFVGSFAEGGRVPATGLALVHEGERISRADGGGGSPEYVVVHTSVQLNGTEIARATETQRRTESRRLGTTLEPAGT
jgi:hypothetical protein